MTLIAKHRISLFLAIPNVSMFQLAQPRRKQTHPRVAMRQLRLMQGANSLETYLAAGPCNNRPVGWPACAYSTNNPGVAGIWQLATLFLGRCQAPGLIFGRLAGEF
jgi:hypothetical protein